MNAECRHCEDANAFVADELSPRDRTAFSLHLAGCPECRAAVDSTRRVLGRLRSVPQVEAATDLAPHVLARLREPLPRPVRWPRIAAVAAALALLAGGALVLRFTKPARQPVALVDEGATHVARALDWFCQIQEADGSWDAEKWGGHRRFEVALTALPALALIGADEPTPQRAVAVAGAIRWLLQQQDATGNFGPEFQGASYNHSIATLALLRAHQRKPEAGLKRALDAALTAAIARQTADGGWGYFHSPFVDRSITEWHLEALELATALGWENARPSLERARAWLAAHPDPRPDVEEPPDSPSALLADTDNAALDFYRAYFLTTALRQEHDESSRQRLATIRHTLLLHQVEAGSESGSWPADDRWGRAGGRLYSTALASLSLRER